MECIYKLLDIFYKSSYIEEIDISLWTGSMGVAFVMVTMIWNYFGAVCMNVEMCMLEMSTCWDLRVIPLVRISIHVASGLKAGLGYCRIVGNSKVWI